MKKNIWKSWEIYGIIAFVLIAIVSIVLLMNNDSKEVNNIKLGGIVTLKEEDKDLLREKSINHLKDYLKTPSTTKFQEEFIYNCTEPNIIEVRGYVDSQNSFGAMIRGNFSCEYFAVENDITTLVYIRYNEEEIFNIKDTYREEYKKQEKLNNINRLGKELNQEKLEYIKEDFNGDSLNDVGKITSVTFNKEESNINVQVTAKSSSNSKEQKEYWSNFDICSILHYFNEFTIIGTIKMNLYDIDNNKILELDFDRDFIENKWKDNNNINKVKEIFGENYKEII